MSTRRRSGRGGGGGGGWGGGGRVFLVNFSTPNLFSKRRNVWQTGPQKGQHTSHLRHKASPTATAATSSGGLFKATQAKQKPFAVSVFSPSSPPLTWKKKKKKKNALTFWRAYTAPVHNRAVNGSAGFERRGKRGLQRSWWKKEKQSVVPKVLA